MYPVEHPHVDGTAPVVPPGVSDQQQQQQPPAPPSDGRSPLHLYAQRRTYEYVYNGGAGAASNYSAANLAPQQQQLQQNQWPAYPTANADVALPTGPWQFPVMDRALHELLQLQRAYLEQGQAIGQAVALTIGVQSMQQQHQQQSTVQYPAFLQQQGNNNGVQPPPLHPLQQHSTGYQQQPVHQSNSMMAQPQHAAFPQHQPLQHHNTGHQQQQPNAPVVQPTPRDNMPYPPSPSIEVLSSMSNGDLEDYLWWGLRELDGDGNDAAPPAAAPGDRSFHEPRATRSSSTTSTNSLMAAPTPYMPQNSQLMSAAAPPTDAAAAAADSSTVARRDWGDDSSLGLSLSSPSVHLQQQPQQQSDVRARLHATPADQPQFRLSPSVSRFDKESVARRADRPVFRFPGKNDMVSLNLVSAMRGFSEKSQSSATSLRHFVKHILQRVYQNPDSSNHVTAGCEKSTKGFKILPEESLQALAEFWLAHFESSETFAVKDITGQMSQCIRTSLNIRRLALKNGRITM